MILIAQEGTQFQDILYNDDREYLAYDLEALTITAIPDSSELKKFLADNKAHIYQVEKPGLGLLQLPNIPNGYANLLKKGTHRDKEGNFIVKWKFDDTKLSIQLAIREILIPYKVVCDRDIYGYILDFYIAKRKLVSKLPCKMKSELASPMDEAGIFVTNVVDTEDYKLYAISVDVKGTSFTTLIVKAHQRVFFVDLEKNEFVCITELS